MATDTALDDQLVAGQPAPPPAGSPEAPVAWGWRLAGGGVRWLVALVALAPIGIYLSVAFRRIGYPYELEWLEGGAVEIVARVAHGHSMYVAPSIHYVPYPYTPLYFWVSALVAKVVGVGFLPLRLVSVVSSIGVFAVLWRLVQQETGDPVAGVAAAGIFAATYKIGLAWFDIGRVDSLYLLMMLLAVAQARRVLRTERGQWADGFAGWQPGLWLGVLVFLAFFTKQSALLALAPMVAALMVSRPRAGIVSAFVATALIVLSTVIYDAFTHGWYSYYVFHELFGQGIVHAAWHTFLRIDLYHWTSWAIVAGLAGLAVGLWRRRSREAWLFWAAVAMGFVGSSWAARLHVGGGQDVLIPAYAAVALVAGLGFGELSRSVPAMFGELATRMSGAAPGRFALNRDGPVRVVVATGLGLLLTVQLWGLRYPTARLLPTAADYRAGSHLIALIRRQPGPVLVFNHPWYATMAGKPAFAQGEALHDILRGGPSSARRDLTASVQAGLASPGISAIFDDTTTDAISPREIGPAFTARYRPGGTVFRCFQGFFPLTDLAVRPYLLYVRRDPPVRARSS